MNILVFEFKSGIQSGQKAIKTINMAYDGLIEGLYVSRIDILSLPKIYLNLSINDKKIFTEDFNLNFLYDFYSDFKFYPIQFKKGDNVSVHLTHYLSSFPPFFDNFQVILKVITD